MLFYAMLCTNVPSLYEPAGLPYTDSDEEEEEGEEEEVVTTEAGLGITAELAAANYEYAGTRVKEIAERITVEDNLAHMDPRTDAALEEVDRELGLDYKTAPFQRVAINLMGTGSSVVLIAECGAGKMDVATKGSLVMRKVMGEPKGLLVMVQPLTSLMVEKMKGKIGKIAVLSMGAEMTMMGEEEGDKVALSCTLEELLSGSITLLIGHPESFATPRGREIMARLQALDRVLGVVVDEFHQVPC